MALAGRGGGATRGCRGLANLGNTCFLNSVTQCLAHTPELVAAFEQGAVSPGAGPLARAFGAVLRELWAEAGASAVVPRSLVDAVGRLDRRFAGGRQHDSQEFLHALLNGLQAELNRVKGRPRYKELEGRGSEQAQADEAWAYSRSWHDSVIDDVFGGQLQSTVECGRCGHRSHCFDPFLDLSVPLPRGARSSSIGHETSVQDCLRAFCINEKLTEKDGFRCEKCARVVPATKKLSIYRFPRVLVVHLKRFSGSGGSRFTSSLSKDNAYVRYELEGLDLAPHSTEAALAATSAPPVYDLYGVSNHSGGLHSGHYTATCRSFRGGGWYSYNDSSVSRSPAGDAASREAYVLFYRRRG